MKSNEKHYDKVTNVISYLLNGGKYTKIIETGICLGL